MTTVEIALEFVREQPIWIGLLALGVCSLLEYVFPPFPGDTITVVGAVLVPTAGWPWWGVLLAVVLGGVVGAGGTWALGDWLVSEPEKTGWAHRFIARPRVASKIKKINTQFEKHGAIYLILNRFIPAFRSFFFVAAGMAGLRLDKVLLFAGISALFWNLALMLVGWTLGNNLGDLLAVVQTYTEVVLGLICVVIIVVLLRGRRSEDEL